MTAQLMLQSYCQTTKDNDHWIGNVLIYPSIWMEAHTYARRGTLSSIDLVTFRLEKKDYFCQLVNRKSYYGALPYIGDLTNPTLLFLKT